MELARAGSASTSLLQPAIRCLSCNPAGTNFGFMFAVPGKRDSKALVVDVRAATIHFEE